MLEYSVSQLPPPDPNDYPYIKGIGAPQEGVSGVDNPVAVLSGPHVAGYPWAGSGMPYPAGPYPFGGLRRLQQLPEVIHGTDPRLFLTVPTLRWD